MSLGGRRGRVNIVSVRYEGRPVKKSFDSSPQTTHTTRLRRAEAHLRPEVHAIHKNITDIKAIKPIVKHSLVGSEQHRQQK